ncbi:alpha-L-fucosidase [Phocaeicola coprocola]
MKKLVIILLSFITLFEGKTQEHAWRDIPYFLKGYESQYNQSPKEAALAWFKDARFGLFIHWGPATLYGKGEWVMFNDKIPYYEYEENTKKFKLEFNL